MVLETKLDDTSKKRSLIKYLIILLAIFIGVYGFIAESAEMAFLRLAVYVILIYCISKGIEEKNILNPYFLFAPVPFSLLVYNVDVSKTYFLDLNSATWFFAIINMIAYLVAVNKTKKYIVKDDYFLGSSESLATQAWLLFVLAQAAQIIPPLQSTLPLLIYPSIACALKSRNKPTIVLMYGLYFLMNMNNLQKTAVLSLLLITLVCFIKYYLDDTKINIKLVLFIALGVVVMLEMFEIKAHLSSGGSFVDYITTNTPSNSVGSYYTERGDVRWDRGENLFLPYMYITTPWTNLQFVMKTQPESTYGLWFIKPILGWLQMDDLAGNAYELTAYSSFNTFTYLAVIFKDFGYLGSMAGSFFLGFFVKRMYNKFCHTISPLDVAVYALVAQAAVEMFFSNHFFTQSYPFTIVVLVGIYRFFMRSFVKRPNTRAVMED